MRPLLFLLAAALGAAVLPSPLHAQSKKTLWKPPIAVSTNVSVWRGESIRIPLRGFQGNNPVAYEIKDQPRHGRLSAITQPDPDRVALSTGGYIVYTHDDSDESFDDKFTFRVRAVRGGGGVSAPASVGITIKDRPPVLVAPSVLDFQAAAGESMTLPLGLTNAGGGFLQIATRANPPFEILGEQVIELPRGASTNVMIRYAPATAGQESRQTLQPGINDSTGARIVLHGRSVAPFEVENSGGEFTLTGHARISSLSLRSRATGRQEVIVTSDPAGLVEVRSPVPLDPGASETIDLLIPAERKGERKEVTVTFATDFYRDEVNLIAPPVPSQLEVTTTQLDYTGNNDTAVLSVTNSGGVTGRFRLNPVPGLAFTNDVRIDAREMEVEPDTQTNIDIRLELRPGEEPPAELLVELGAGRLERIAITAPRPSPTPSPTASPIIPPPPPPPQPKPWKLNKDIRLATADDGSESLEWKTSLDGWQEPQLEINRGGGWETYTPPEKPKGIIERFGDWISGFFGGLVPDRDVPSTNDEPAPMPEWTDEAIDSAFASNEKARWRITAKKGAPGKRQPASEEFRIDWKKKKLVKAESRGEPAPSPAPTDSPQTAAPTTASPSPTPTIGVRRVIPALKVESARADPQRHSATVQVIFPRDPEANGYRLEHGFNPTLLDPASGLPYAGDFRIAPHPSAVATVQGTAETEHEGRELTVLVATIEGLTPGTSTTWRVVTMADGEDRWPTGEFIVSTLPPWRFPWRQAGLVAAFLALGAVLYLRWRINRAPH